MRLVAGITGREMVVKKQIVKAMVAVVVLMGAASAVAQESWSYSLRADVPFEFVVRGVTMPAGEYTVSLRSGAFGATMMAQTGGKTALLSQALTAETWNGINELIFEQIGGTYYLTEIRDTRAGVRRIQQDKHYVMARKAAPPEPRIVAAK